MTAISSPGSSRKAVADDVKPSTGSSATDARLRLLELLSLSWLSRALCAVAQLRVPDALECGPRHVDDLAAELGCHADRLDRVLRAAVSYGVFRRRDDGAYALNDAGRLLCSSEAPDSMRNIALMAAADWHWDAWKGLERAIVGGRSAFEEVHGSELFSYLDRDPNAAATFHAAMSEFQQLAHGALIEAFDFAQVGSLVDVGGSHGDLLRLILTKHPAIEGTLFDRPAVIEKVCSDAAERPTFDCVGGDFFDAVPPGRDAYLLSTIIHDWDDEDARRILRTCRAAMHERSRLLLAERIIPESDERFFGKLMDLEMMVLPGGRERTLSEFTELISAAGFTLAAVHPSRTPMSVLEARPARERD